MVEYSTVSMLGLVVVLMALLLSTHWRCTELREQLAAAELAAETDPLTGLSNRAGLHRALDELGAERGQHVGAIAIDLDGLKGVNDSHGHHVGDQVLVQVAQRIGAVGHRTRCVARVGGDEFVVLLDGYADAPTAYRDAATLAQSLRDRIKWPRVISHPPVAIAASVGIAVVPTKDIDELLRAADHAMYKAKASGFSVADPTRTAHHDQQRTRVDARPTRNVV